MFAACLKIHVVNIWDTVKNNLIKIPNYVCFECAGCMVAELHEDRAQRRFLAFELHLLFLYSIRSTNPTESVDSASNNDADGTA